MTGRDPTSRAEQIAEMAEALGFTAQTEPLRSPDRKWRARYRGPLAVCVLELDWLDGLTVTAVFDSGMKWWYLIPPGVPLRETRLLLAVAVDAVEDRRRSTSRPRARARAAG